MGELASLDRADGQTGDRLKVPPHSIEAEQSVLGGLMIDNGAWDTIADIITETDYYRQDHRLIFRALSHLANNSEPLDIVTVSEWLEQYNDLDKVGGLAYLSTLAQNTPSAANIKAYAAIVRERSVLRQLIRVSGEIGDNAFNPEGRSSSEVLDIAEQKVFQISESNARGRQGFQSITNLLPRVVERIDQLHEQGGEITGLGTGFRDLDRMTSGLQPADLIIVAGRPSMGKTSFAMNIAENIAMEKHKAVAIFSMEMPAEQLVLRILSSLGRVDQSKVRSGRLDDDDWPRLTSTMNILNEAPLFIDDTPALTPTELRSRARRLKREHDLGVIVIDYLQLMQVIGSKENRTNEISEISRSLKALAKELNVPVIALSQLNRSLEQRPNKRPVMSDLRESGAIEQDADLITFIYRDEVYNEESPDKGTAEIIIGKQRNGPIGTVRLTFIGQYTRFENFAHDNYGSAGGFSGGYE
jgi:replicative DNA helicase